MLIKKCTALSAVLTLLSACTTQDKYPQEDVNTAPGQTSVIQTATSETETFINILRPRLRNFDYRVTVDGAKSSAVTTKYNTLAKKELHWVVDQIHITGLQKGTTYELNIVSPRYKTVMDQRLFKTLDLEKNNLNFVLGSCMSDAHTHAHMRGLIWDKVYKMKPDMLILTGDIVYVDSHDFVSRKKVNEFDIWQRYIDNIRALEVFRKKELTPVLATWDDHDFGLNNADKNFPHKKLTRDLFQSFFGSQNIEGVFENGHDGVYKSFQSKNQRFFLLDNRYFREPTGSKKDYAHTGEKQHLWLMNRLKTSHKPSWIVNGGQFFTKPVVINSRGRQRQINEGFRADHPVHFESFIKDLKGIKSPLVFASGDIHFSELLNIENVFDYQTFEITSSPMHAYIFRPRKAGDPMLWENPLRIAGHKDYNFLYVQSEAHADGFHIDVASYGVKQDKPFFQRKLDVHK